MGCLAYTCRFVKLQAKASTLVNFEWVEAPLCFIEIHSNQKEETLPI